MLKRLFCKLIELLDSKSKGIKWYLYKKVYRNIKKYKWRILKNSNLFKNRLGDLYDFSIVKNEFGKGNLYDSNSNRWQVDWALNMDLRGEITFVISMKEDIHYDQDGEFVYYDLDGYTLDNVWLVRGEKVIFHEKTFDMEADIVTYIGTAQVVEFKKKNFDNNNGLYLKAAINNFNFHGLQFTKNGNRNIRNKFTTIIQGKSVEFKLFDNSESLNELIQGKRVENAVMSSLSFNVEDKYNIGELDVFLRNISWFISLITLNTTFIPYMEIANDKDVIYKKLIGGTLNFKYSNNVLIDNFYIRGGIKNIIESTFEEFLSIKDGLEITKIINTLLKIEKENIIEFKLVFLLLAYEQMTTKFLLLNGRDEKTVKDYNIQQKIQQINSILRFIPSSHQGDDLRDNVRNDIFHLGDLPLLSFNQKLEIFNKYHELLYKILFRILKYNGKYISRITNQPIDM